MGSLMAGWSSPFRDPEHAKFQRNKSLTRGEINAYWRSTSKNEEERLIGDDVSNDNQHLGTLADLLRVQGKGESSSYRPLCWWTRSASAFLNEAPVTAMEGPSCKYAAQWLQRTK
ncbi:uncharacterized protein LOC121977814 [Zingiber officinale]|uniref:Uncharacterized protein n=1 Tax=Zingiber officinale TaxID=94328 RepID=A0A8J5GPW0_ZINOF|nr:uncharacterized protein LOC121977814 [Zingiber officinale]KAG6511593.1 hypothetical protein ZIOFF_029666 [Zingiber officinale]